MKAVIKSVSPRICEKVANGDCKILISKTAPKCAVLFKGYIYATKAKKWFRSGIILTSNELLWLSSGKLKMCDGFELWADGEDYQCVNGKVIGEFICDKVDKYTFSHYEAEYRVTHVEQNAMCLNQPELMIYDKPKELREFKTPPCEKNEKACGNCKWLVKINTPDVYECECYVEDGRPITRPPQSWQYVEELKNGK